MLLEKFMTMNIGILGMGIMVLKYREFAAWLIALAGYFVVVASSIAEELPLHRIADLRHTSRAESALHPRVRIRGLVSWNSKRAETFTVESESAGIWISLDKAREAKIWQGDDALLARLRPGVEVELEGVLDPRGYSPTILPQHLRVLGEKELPPPSQVPLAQFMSGAADCQRLQVSGVVQNIVDAGHWLIKIATQAGSFSISLDKESRLKPQDWVDAQVTVSGLAVCSRNWRGEISRPLLLLSHDSDIVVEKAPIKDPFLAPKRPVSEMSTFSPEGRALHRQRIEGTVTYQDSAGIIYIQDAAYGVRVEAITKERFLPGDQVEAAGFIDTTQNIAGLGGALIRKLGNAKLPLPLPISLEEIRQDRERIRRGLSLRHPGIDGLLVSIQGHLLSQQGPSADGMIRLEIDTGESISTAFVREQKLNVMPGSEVRVTGVAEVQYTVLGQEYIHPLPSRLDVLMRDRNDLLILKAPSWWNTRRLYGAVAFLALALVLGGFWIYQLRRLVRRQTRRWEQVLCAHRDSELEMKGAREERYRLAGDLHDGLQQHLTGASYRLEAAMLRLGDQTPEVEEQFSAARAALERTRTGLRECLLGLRVFEEGPADFSALLRHAAHKMEHWPKEALEITVTGEPFALSRHVMGTLLLFMQEAVENAFKHGAASHVKVNLGYFSDRLEMHIKDDGGGFDPALAPDSSAGHFGVESMRHRLRWLGGEFQLNSRPSEGTQLIAVLSRKKAEESPDAIEFKEPSS